MERMKEIIMLLNEARDSYYVKNDEIMSNFEYDELFDELVRLEQEFNIVLENSPTTTVGYAENNENGLKKVKHEINALSLEKTKDIEELKEWLGEEAGVLSWKLDGLTVQLTYNNGRLELAATRGNGEIGEDITENAKYFKGIPLEISYKEKLIIRGEATISYSEFLRINDTLNDGEEKYKNPRNLASATARASNSGLLKDREVTFNAFSIVSWSYKQNNYNLHSRLIMLSEMGFNVVFNIPVNASNLPERVEYFQQNIEIMQKNISDKGESTDIPVDGLVVAYDNISYGESLGVTSHHAKSGMAFKFADEEKETTVCKIFWSASKTGRINPVVVFDPVELEGTTVKRASVHNLSILNSLGCGIGSKILVYKANMIIPQVSKVIEKVAIEIPGACPICGKPTTIKTGQNGSEVLFCENKNCNVKQTKRFVRFCERNAMNMEGISEATLETLLSKSVIKNLKDLFALNKYETDIISMEGFGEKSYQNMIAAVNKSKTVKMSKFLYALGISNFGKDATKIVSKEMTMDCFIENLNNGYDFTRLDGIGEIINASIFEWWNEQGNRNEILNLMEILDIENEVQNNSESKYSNLIFVITGSLENYANREELKTFIEENGGKVSGSVSKNTSYLINNDAASTSGKNKKAKELNVQVITEIEFLKL